MTYPPEARHDGPPQSRSAPMPPMSVRPVGRLELDLDIDQALDDLQRAFPGICIWYGDFSGSLWALLPDRLVEAKSAADLARQLPRRSAPAPPASPPHARSPCAPPPAVHPPRGRHLDVRKVRGSALPSLICGVLLLWQAG
ncbi:hypothetical protein [Actinomadura sp. GTD37]|uniref:hypothetical protein n=1 Tax=Actinomadura sp. GTD37 TaxID=1778030 RepID=UPI0035C07353